MARLRLCRTRPKFLEVFKSWLSRRRATVVVGGVKSKVLTMTNMVYQGTVWGPFLWNIFAADASTAIQSCEFEDVFFADDLNASKAFDASVPDDLVFADLDHVQNELHLWGEANQISFDAGKESKHIISKSRPVGEDFKLLGITFDCKLLMHKTISECTVSCGWKLKSILRTRRFF